MDGFDDWNIQKSENREGINALCLCHLLCGLELEKRVLFGRRACV